MGHQVRRSPQPAVLDIGLPAGSDCQHLRGQNHGQERCDKDCYAPVDISATLASIGDHDVLAQAVVEKAVAIVDKADICALYLHDSGQDILVLRRVHLREHRPHAQLLRQFAATIKCWPRLDHYTPPFSKADVTASVIPTDAQMRWRTTFSTGEAIVRRSFTSGKTVVYTVNTDAGLSGTPTGSKRTSGGTVGKSFDLSDAIAAPLICKGQAVGVLVLASQKRRPVFNKLQVCLVEALANQLAVAIENARLCKELLAEEAIRSEILQKLISAQEDERRRIARELHDETSQALTALIIGLETAEDSLPIDARDAKRHLESARLLTVQTLEEVRKIVMDLRPTLLDDLGLVPALRWYSKTQAERLALKLTFESRGLQGRLPPQLEVALFRIVQEAITNIARHAEARSVKVQLVRSGSSLVAVIEDDGKGFEVSEYFGEGRKSNGFGLLGMKERASVLGGTLEIHSRAGRGTRVTVTVPVSGTVQGSPLEVRPLVT